jgi:tetratricopeptide (TPR) repeat protein
VAWYSLLFARADSYYRDDNLASVQTAARLVPGNAAYRLLLGEMLEAEGANPDAELETAARLSPHESIYWIRLAFRAEVERKYEESERYLAEAYSVDRGFDPRWALMNYYFRRGREREFWSYARQAFDMSYGNLDPVFRLCLAMNDDPSVTRNVIPPRREITFAFLKYLVQHQRVQAASSIAAELAPAAEPEELPLFMDYCDKQMTNDNRSSLTVWNALCRRRLIPFSELNPERGLIVTDGDFSVEPLQQGFDWKYGAVDGIAVSPINATQGISIGISGKEPDTATLIGEEVPLTPGKRYLLSYTYRLIGGQPDSGVEWVLQGTGQNDTPPGAPIATSSVFSATDWTTAQMPFLAGQRNIATLILQYRRLPATLRWKGTVQIRRITSALASADFAGPGPSRIKAVR